MHLEVLYDYIYSNQFVEVMEWILKSVIFLISKVYELFYEKEIEPYLQDFLQMKQGLKVLRF